MTNESCVLLGIFVTSNFIDMVKILLYLYRNIKSSRIIGDKVQFLITLDVCSTLGNYPETEIYANEILCILNYLC